jgi:hypothetical protein
VPDRSLSGSPLITLWRQPPYLSGTIAEGITIALPNKNHRPGYKHVCTDFSLALAVLEMRSMKMRSAVFAVILMICSVSSQVAHATDTFDPAYRETTFLMVEADLRLHLCQLQEFSLYLLPSQATTGTESPAPPGPTSQAPMIAEEHTLFTVFLCRREAEEAIKARLQAAEHELIERPTAQEKLKGFVAAWLSAMKALPRKVPGTEVLLAQQDADRRGVMQKQSELEVELFWALDRAQGWVSRGSPSS